MLLAEKPAVISLGLFLKHFSALWLHKNLKTHVLKPQPEGQALPLLAQHHHVQGRVSKPGRETHPGFPRS